ncbi:type I toxin-antitoxin system Fst family toxin [Ligilactobacillus acidipiscis]|nr:type I toxin-antitoxin system Fst family toxin [Ligilactobacillus acidipiscis]
MFVHFISLIVAPIIVGTVNTLFSYWLERKDKDDDH